MELITIIVPVYNAENFLEKCLDSIINQTYKNLEIILVDDGSTDSSLKMCNEYAKKDKRIKVIHTVNRRQAAARNTAIDNATGDYIFFVDSDDWIRNYTIQSLVDAVKKYDADIAVCNAFREENGVVSALADTDFIKEMSRYEALESYAINTPYCSHCPCDKLYKKKLFDNTRFVENRYYEDLCSVFKFVGNADKVVYIDKKLYCYVKNTSSTMNKPFSKHSYDKIYGYIKLQEYLSDYPDLAKKVTVLLVGSIQYCVGETLAKNMQSELENEYNQTIQLAKSINLKELGIKQKLLLTLIKICPKAYGILYKRIKE